MPPVSKKKNITSYSQEILEQALKEIRKDKKGIRETCKKYGIPKTTIYDRITGKRGDKLKSRGPEPILGSTEKDVVQWMVNLTKRGFPLKKQELLDTVQKILKDNRKENPFKDDRPGQTWYCSFLKRNPEISRLTAESAKKARARPTVKSIRLWFREVENFLMQKLQLDVLQQPNRIFNAVERGFSLCPTTGNVIGPEDYQNISQIKAGGEKSNLTVLIMCNASGQVCPPLIVFPFVRPPTAITDSKPPEWSLGKGKIGWMKNSDVLFEYITNDFNAWLEENNIPKPILLLIDGTRSHMSFVLSTTCEQLGIILYSLPPNTNHMLQPAELGVFAPLKMNWRYIVEEFLARPENVNKSVTKTNFCKLFRDVIEHPQTASNIINGFRQCGLYPFDRDAVDFTNCDQKPRKQVNRPKPQIEITNQDIKSTRKVLRYLKPILIKNRVDLQLIAGELKKLRKKTQDQDNPDSPGSSSNGEDGWWDDRL